MMRAYLSNNWKSQITILWLGQAILMAVMAMSLPYWPLYISKLGEFSPLEIRYWSAAIYIAPFISSIFSSPFWGKLGDKYGYKSMVIRACLGLLITQTLILFVSNVFLIFIIRLLQGALAGFISAAQAWALGMSPESARGETIGKLQAATAIGNLLGPLSGGIIATYAGYHAIFTSSTIICLIVTIMFYLFLTDAPSSIQTDKKISINLKLFSNLQSIILSLLTVIIVMQLARSIITPIFALFVTEKLGGNDITIGVLYAATGLMIFITAPFWGKFFDNIIQNKRQTNLIIVSLLFISSVLQILHAYSESVLTIFLLRLLWGICLGALLPVMTRLLVDNGKENERGLVLGFGNSAVKLGNLIGIILGALVEAHFGYTHSFIMNAALYLIAAGIMLTLINPATMISKGEYSLER